MTYSHVTSPEIAEREGLVKIYLYPAAFGGSHKEEDTRWIPPEAAAEKDKFDAMVKARFDDGRIGAYLCTVTDAEGSLVPHTVLLRAFTRGIPVFVHEIPIWDH